MFKELLNAPREKKLGEAIARLGFKVMTEYLNPSVSYTGLFLARYGAGSQNQLEAVLN